MFKPLLRTLPTLNGNFTLACPLQEINKKNPYTYEVNIRHAQLMSLQNIIDNLLVIPIDLLDGKYEYDITKYYKHMLKTQNFYESYYTLNDSSHVEFNKTYDYDFAYGENLHDSRNKDYEFGCKHISYDKYKYQFMFFAPIYVDNYNSLPQYFVIELRYSNNDQSYINAFTKKIYINITNKNSKNYSYNYLNVYLREYINKIDQNVLKINNSHKCGIYYGVDVKNGGLQAYKYDNLKTIFSKYYDIRMFDKSLINGFKETGQIMRQIIPLSFLFNIDDFLTFNEKLYLHNKRFSVRGYYESNSQKYNFYDFDFNYDHYYINCLNYNNESGRIEHIQYIRTPNDKSINTDNNYPNAFNKIYGRWKLLYSLDDNPYIMNTNYLYSINNIYGEFPHNYNQQELPYVLLQNNYNIILPYDKSSVGKYDNVNLSLFKNYINNYYTNWFEYKDYTNTSKIVNGYTYFRGILYNVKNLLYEYQKELDKKDFLTTDEQLIQLKTIDDYTDFGVYMHLNYNQLIGNVLLSKYSIEVSDNNNCVVQFNNPMIINFINGFNPVRRHNKHNYHTTIFEPLLSSSAFNAEISLNKNFKKISQNIHNENDLEKYDNIYVGLNELNYNSYIKVSFMKSLLEFGTSVIPSEQISLYSISGYEKINISHNDVYDFIINYVYSTEYPSRFTNLKKILYISKANNSTKYAVSTLDLNTLSKNESYSLFVKSSFIALSDLYILYRQYSNQPSLSYKNFENIFYKQNRQLLDDETYVYCPHYNKDNILLTDYFNKYQKFTIKHKKKLPLNISDKKYSDHIFIDSYNLQKYIRRHNQYIYSTHKDNNNTRKIYIVDTDVLNYTPYKEAYIRMDDMEMLTLYQNELHKDEKYSQKYNDKIYVVVKQLKTLSKYYEPCIDTYNITEEWTYKQFSDRLKEFTSYDSIYDESDTSKYITVDGLNNFIYHKDSKHIYYANIYIKKKIYLFTAELAKLLKFTEPTVYKPLYLLIPDRNDKYAYYGYDGKTPTMSSISLFDTYKFMIPNNLYYNQDIGFYLYNIFNKSKNIQIEKCGLRYGRIVTTGNNPGKHLPKNIKITKTTEMIDNKRIIYYHYSEHPKYHPLIAYKTIDYNLDILLKIYPNSCFDDNTTNKLLFDDRIQKYEKYDILDSQYELKFDDDSIKIFINMNIDNSFNSLNTISNLLNNIKFKTINGKELSQPVINQYFEYIIPFLKTNIFKSFINKYNGTVIKPQELQLIYNDNKQYAKYTINRYLSDCTPLLTMTNSFNDYSLTINDRKNILKYESINVWKNNPIYDSLKDRYQQYYEYKHFNDSLLYNLESEIVVEYKHNIYYEEVQEKLKHKGTDIILKENTLTYISNYKGSSNNISYQLFKSYIETKYLINDIYDYTDENEYNNHFLFLYNKYNISVQIKPVTYDSLSGKTLYHITFTFKLK